MKAKKIQQGYPRTYESSARRFLYGLEWMLLALFLGMTPVHLLGLIKNPISPRDLVLMDTCVVAFVIWIWSQASRRVLIYEDAIEVTGWLSTRKLHCSEILGRRMGKLPKQAGASLDYIIIPTWQQSRAKAASLSEGRQVFFRLDESDSEG